MAFLIAGVALVLLGALLAARGERFARRQVLGNARYVQRVPLFPKKVRAQVLDPEYQNRMARFNRIVSSATLFLFGGILIASGIVDLMR